MTASQAGGDSVPQASAPQEREQAPAFSAADVLTVIRVPLAVAFVAWPDPVGRILVLAGAAVTDLLDGRVARRFGASRLGAFLDPVADKFLVCASLLILVELDRVSALIALVIIGREIAISALREWMAQIGASRSVAVHMLGKLKTSTQMVAIPFLLYDGVLFRVIDTRIWGTVLIYIAAVLTIWSMVYYLQKALPEIRAKSR